MSGYSDTEPTVNVSSKADSEASHAEVAGSAPAPPDGRRLFDVRAAVAYFHSLGATSVTPNFVRGLISSGAIPYLRLGKKFYLSRASLDHWLENHERRSR